MNVPFSSLRMDLAWFAEVLAPLATEKLAKLCAEHGVTRLGLAPYNALTRTVGGNLIAAGLLSQEQIDYFDRAGDPNGYDALGRIDPDLLVVLSPNWGEEIIAEIARHWERRGRVVNYFSVSEQVMAVSSAAARLAALAEREDGHELMRLCGERPVVLVVSTFFYDVETKLSVLVRERGYRVVRVSPETRVRRGEGGHDCLAPLPAVLAWLRLRQSRPGDFWLVSHPVNRFLMNALLHTLEVRQPVISYIYDAWEDLFPRGMEERAVCHYNTNDAYVAGEYAAFRGVVQGQLCDGFFYKDLIGDRPYMDGASVPHCQLHTALPLALHQAPTVETAGNRSIVYIGTLLSPLSGRGTVWENSYVDKLFARVAAQGFTVDVYYPPDSEGAATWYRERLKDEPRVRIRRGKPLDRLLPELAGRYAWGWLMVNPYSGPSVAVTQTGIPSRLYAFLALGIPVLISDFLAGAAEFVRSRGIGLAVADEDVDRLGALIQGADYSGMRERVLRVREELCLERCQGEFLDFVDQVLGRSDR